MNLLKKYHLNNKSGKNLITGLIYQLTNTLMGFILPYLFITSFGSETNGLLSSITQLFVYLDLLEAGVGIASQQALYKPCSVGDKKEINAILSATNVYYKRTGVIYGVLMLVLAFAYPLFTNSSLSYMTIVLVILLHGMGGVLTYFVRGKYNIFLKAEGKVYIINVIMLFTSILKNAGKIIVIYLGGNVILVQFVQFCVILAQMIITLIYIKKKYNWLDFSVKPNTNAISQKNSVLLQSITTLVFNNTDVMVLTILTGNLALVSVYSIYLMIFEAVQYLVDSVKESFQYKLGWKSQTSTQEFDNYYHKYENFYLAATFGLFAVTYILIIPFLKLYIGDVSDADYFLQWLPELFLCVKILYSIRGLNKQVIEATGHFKKTQFIAIGEIIINLTTSIVLVLNFGIYGALIGTILALIFSDISYLSYVNKKIFMKFYMSEMLELFIYSGILVVLTYFLQEMVKNSLSYFDLVIKAIPIMIIVFACFGIVACIINLFISNKDDNK